MKKTAMRSISALLVIISCLGIRANASNGGERGVLRATLSNGLRVIIVRNTLAPVVTTMMNYRVGSNEAPPGFPGMAHAQEHMMFRGSPGLSANQLADIAAAMGGNFDADTQQMVTQYFFTVPAEDLDVALHIEAIRMSGVLDTNKLWDKERGAIEQEVAQDLSNPEYVFYTKLLASMFKGTPLAHDALGTRASFNKTTGAMLKKFHETWYAPNNAVLIIVGDVNFRQALAEVKGLFSGIPSKKLPARPPIRLGSVRGESLTLPTDLPYGLAVASFRMPGSNSPEYAASEVLSDVLSSQRGTLYGLVPAGKALFAGFAYSSFPTTGLGYALSAFPKGANGEALLREMRQILTEDIQHGVPADLVTAAKRHELAGAEFEKNSVSGLAMAWSEAVAIEGRNSPEDDIRAIQKVTVEDVDRVARQYLTMNSAIRAVLNPQSSGKPISGRSFGGKESFAPKQVKPVSLPSWASAALERLTVPETTMHPVVTMLPNGIKLIVQPVSISNTVSVYGRIKSNADLETPKGEDGANSLLSQLFSYGTTTLNRMGFQKALDEIGANESAGTDFSVEALASHFDRGVSLLADNELHPALPQHAFQVIQPQTAATIAGELQSPSFLTHHALEAALYPKHDPTLRHATPQTVKSLTLSDVRHYYSHVFRPDLTTIVVIGKVTPSEAKAAIEKYFGAWKASGPKPQTVLPSVPVSRPSGTNVPDSSRVQDQVTLAETLGLNRFNPDYYGLELGNHVLGGGFYASRLYQDLRENTGLVYFVSSSIDSGRTRTVYDVSYGCDPPNVSKARAIIVRDLRAMQTSPATPHELRQARALLLREIPLSESSVDSIAAGWLARSVMGLPLDEPTLAARKYVQITAAQVQAAFAKWVRPGDLVQVVEGPKPQ
ncbi:MAG: M16 family metallopeptidase [Terriglobia bacterium]